MGVAARSRVREAADGSLIERVAGRRTVAGWLAETAAALTATALAVLLLAHLVGSPRAWLLFYDGDSVLPALLAGSIRAEQGADFALSAVAFVPESAVYLALAALALPVQATLALNAVVNLVALYAALRLVAGAVRPRRPGVDDDRPAVGPAPGLALAAFAVFVGFALLESSASRETLELASPLATTTYYSAAVIATVVCLALLVRILRAVARRATARRDTVRRAVVALAAVTAISVMSNPIVALWSVAPLLALAALALAFELAPRRRLAAGAIALAAGSAIGAALRLPLAGVLTEGSGDKVHLAGSAASARYYAHLLAQRWNDGGWPVIVVVALLLALGVAGTVVALRDRRLAPALVATASWLIPFVAVLGAVALGTQSPRYLQPALFSPVLAVIAAPALGRLLPVRARPAMRAGRMRAPRLAGPLALALAAGMVAAATVAGATTARALDTVDASVGCVVDWVDASARTGVGTFWTVRAPKAYLADPRRLVQVDWQLNGYAWLVDREDYLADRASFIVASDEGGPVAVPAGLPEPERIECGRYTILDYGSAVLEIGPAHS